MKPFDPLHRRAFVRGALGAIGATTFTPLAALGCRTPGGAAGLLKEEPLPPGMEWLRSIDSIQPARFPQTDFSGDLPTFAHKWLRDQDAGPDRGAPAETASVVIVGGGIAGLAAAYLLRDHKPIILEQAQTFGGNARGESWEGVEYALGSAHLAKPRSGDPLLRAFYRPLRLDERWRVASDKHVMLGGSLHADFWVGGSSATPGAKAQMQKLRDYLRTVYDEGGSSLPPKAEDGVSEALKKLDMKTLLTEVEAAVGGSLSAPLRSLIEHYCWSQFGAGAREISAAAGLSFLAAEMGGVCALPGGNAKVASSLLRAAAEAGVPAENFRVGSVVRLIEPEPNGSGVRVQARRPDGSTYVILAHAVVVATPKYVAQRIMPDLPQEQLDAMGALKYRSYLVANVLIDQPLGGDAYDIYIGGDEKDEFDEIEAAAATQRATNAIVGQWAQGGHPTHSVLSLYRSFPFEGARSLLLKAGAFTRYRDEFLAQVPGVMKAIGASSAGAPPVDRVRVTRWGHPLCVAAPGLIATGTAQKAAESLGPRIHFCNQDDWALPAIETSLSSALRAAQKVREVLA